MQRLRNIEKDKLIQLMEGEEGFIEWVMQELDYAECSTGKEGMQEYDLFMRICL